MWSHLSFESGERHTNREIRHSKPLNVKTFRELVPAVARLANHNADYTIFFRGQAKNYTTSKGASSIYPTIFRSPGKSLTGKALNERFVLLRECSRLLLKGLEAKKVEDIDRLKKFPELQWSILQHYEVCGTPLVDLTHSLRVAASFGLNDSNSSALVLAFALPHPQGTITYSTEDELLNIRLLSASPAAALRPHFQEGYLSGSFPSEPKRKMPSLDLGVRLVGKFEISSSNFWDKNFHAIPRQALYPDGDEIDEICSKIKIQVSNSQNEIEAT